MIASLRSWQIVLRSWQGYSWEFDVGMIMTKTIKSITNSWQGYDKISKRYCVLLYIIKKVEFTENCVLVSVYTVAVKRSW